MFLLYLSYFNENYVQICSSPFKTYFKVGNKQQLINSPLKPSVVLARRECCTQQLIIYNTTTYLRHNQADLQAYLTVGN